jgi:hypothetical protein
LLNILRLPYANLAGIDSSRGPKKNKNTKYRRNRE